MTVKTESSAAAFSDANMPPANITMAGTVFKSFIYQESVQQKRDHRGPGNFLKDQRLASPER